MHIREKKSEKLADGLIPYDTTTMRRHPPAMKLVAVGNTHSSENFLIDAPPLHEWKIRVGWAHSTEQAFMNVLETLENQYKEAAKLWSKYDEKLKSFRSIVKNDITSLEASGRAAALAVNKIRDAHNKTLEILNSAEMEQAIRNAERLADALERIQGLKSHKLTLAVLDASPQGAS